MHLGIAADSAIAQAHFDSLTFKKLSRTRELQENDQRVSAAINLEQGRRTGIYASPRILKVPCESQ